MQPSPTKEAHWFEAEASWLERHWRKLVVGFLLVGLILSVIHGWAESFLATKAATRSPIATFEVPGKSGLVVWMSLDRVPILSTEPSELVLGFENQSSAEIEIKLGELRAPGFSPSGSSRFRVRRADKRPQTFKNTVIRLKPDQEDQVTVPLVSYETLGRFELSASGAWKQLGKSREEPWTLSLHDVQVVSPRATFLAHTAKAFISLLGILALPLLLALGGAWFQHRQQSIALGKQERQRRIDHERQAWANMLPVSHKNNTELYLPLLSGILSVESDYDRCREAIDKGEDVPPEDLRELLFHLLFSALRRRVIVDTGAGYHLKTREGEDLVMSTLDDGFLIDGLRSHLADIETQNRVLDLMEPNESYSSYVEKVYGSARPDQLAFSWGRSTRPTEPLSKTIEKLEGKMKSWLTEDDAVAKWWFKGLLRMGHLVLLFELNRIYRFWYGKEPDCPVEGIGEAARVLSWVPKGRKYEARKRDQIHNLLKSYESRLIADGLLEAGALTSLKEGGKA